MMPPLGDLLGRLVSVRPDRKVPLPATRRVRLVREGGTRRVQLGATAGADRA